MALTNRKAHFLWSVVVVFIIQLPLLIYYASGIGSFLILIGVFLLVALAVGGGYVALVNKLHADRAQPIPWYASPVVWLGVPLLVLTVFWLAP